MQAASDPDIARIDAAFAALHKASRRDVSPSLEQRRDRLRRLAGLTTDWARAFEAAISDDFGHRCVQETRLAEALVVEAEIAHALRHLRRWMRPRRIATRLHFLPGWNRLMPQPLGVVGVIAPWNYPLQLTLAPVVAALAAGNRVMIKPSELVPRFSAALAAAVAAHFAADEIDVVTGEADVAQHVAALPFDHLVFTGSTRVGRLVAQAAARNLTPVTLELGGKSPAIIDRSADLAMAARRIAFGKLLNAGQTCIAPDYVLCPAGLQQPFVAQYRAAVAQLYGSDPGNPDYSAIISPAHYDRLERLLADAADKGAQVERLGAPGAAARAARKFPPSLVLNTRADMQVRQEEIFGPILPVIACETADEAIAFVAAGERPLALYWFGSDAAARDAVLRGTVSGGVTVNDCLLHLAQENQPFGGVGASGSGAYHGEWGFRAMSKEKPVFYQTRFSGSALFMPPYGATFDRLFALLRRMI
jgi:coniferyl-aldehyde dehydrogenase